MTWANQNMTMNLNTSMKKQRLSELPLSFLHSGFKKKEVKPLMTLRLK